MLEILEPPISARTNPTFPLLLSVQSKAIMTALIDRPSYVVAADTLRRLKIIGI